MAKQKKVKLRDVLEWLDKFASNKDDDRTPEQKALWWLANIQAEDLCDLSQRELASLCLDGMKPLTLRDVRQHLANLYEEDADAFSIAETNDLLWEDLNHFWRG